MAATSRFSGLEYGPPLQDSNSLERGARHCSWWGKGTWLLLTHNSAPRNTLPRNHPRLVQSVRSATTQVFRIGVVTARPRNDPDATSGRRTRGPHPRDPPVADRHPPADIGLVAIRLATFDPAVLAGLARLATGVRSADRWDGCPPGLGA